jgi:response regulator NasT
MKDTTEHGDDNMGADDGMRALLVDDDRARAHVMQAALRAEGHSVVACIDTGADVCAAAATHHAGMVLVGVETLDARTLGELARLNRQQPRPVVVFAHHSDAQMTRRAVAAGVSAYVVDGFQPSRLSAVLDVARARFEVYQTLLTQLEDARSRLADNRDIEKAKGMLMQRRNLSESEAYSLLRKQAMERKQRIGDFARLLLDAADAL